MPGRNCAFFGCPTSQKHKLSLFQIPVVSAKQSEYTAATKKKSREEWFKIILRTREMTPEMKRGLTVTIYMFVNACLNGRNVTIVRVYWILEALYCIYTLHTQFKRAG